MRSLLFLLPAVVLLLQNGTFGLPRGECPAVDGAFPVYLADSENKSIFYECSSGHPVKMECPPGLEFDTIIRVCTFPKNANLDKPEEICPESDGKSVTLVRDKDNCRQFYMCESGKAYHATCPLGLVFNAEKSFCDFPANVDCHSGEPDMKK